MLILHDKKYLKNSILVKSVYGLLLIMFLSIQYGLWVGDKNIFQLNKLKESVAVFEQEIADIENQNQKRHAQIIDLKNQGETVESLARLNLGYIKKGETFFQVIEPEAAD